MSIVFIILIIVLIYIKKQEKEQAARKRLQKPASEEINAPAFQQQNVNTYQQKKRTVSQEDRRRLEEYRAKQTKQDKSDILTKAQKNARKYEKDVTLEQLEKEHAHPEQVKAALSKEERLQHKELHQHNASHVAEVVCQESDSILGTIEDLMVKGYESHLSFERDFVGEAMDMIGTFTLGKER